MNREVSPSVDHERWEQEALHERQEREAKEGSARVLYEEMVAFARDVGCKRYFPQAGGRYLEFATWQEALDFQEICGSEKGLTVRVVEPPKNDKSVISKGYKVFAVEKNKK